MVYETFLKTLKQDLQQLLGGNFLISIQKIPKNNGIILDSLCISDTEALITPTIHLAPYYEQYQNGIPLDIIEQDILTIFHEPFPSPIINPEHFTNLEQVKDKVVFRLIHAKSNRTLLDQLPHKTFLDLAIVFYLYLDDTEYGQLTSLIYESHKELWELSTDELFILASYNTPKLFPAKIQTMSEIMKEILQNSFTDLDQTEMLSTLLSGEDPLSPLYVLTNCQGFCGSCCILYPNILKDFAKTLNQDLVILPSSIHEVLIIPHEEQLQFDDLTSMVTEINHTEVPLEDQLSNQVYRYSRETNSIEIANSSYPIPDKILPN